MSVLEVKGPEGLLRKKLFLTHVMKTIACSKRSDSGERCEVKKAMKSRGGLGREAFYFFALLFTRTAPHHLNAWNRL